MHKWAFNEGVGSFQFDLNFFENEYFDAELDNLAVSVGKPVYFNVEMNGGKCSKFLVNGNNRLETVQNFWTVRDFVELNLNTPEGNYLNNVEFRVTDCTVKERMTPANTFTIFDYTNEQQCYNQERFHINAYSRFLLTMRISHHMTHLIWLI